MLIVSFLISVFALEEGQILNTVVSADGNDFNERELDGILEPVEVDDLEEIRFNMEVSSIEFRMGHRHTFFFLKFVQGGFFNP